MHIFCIDKNECKEKRKIQKIKQRGFAARGDTDTRLHQVIREKGFYNMTLKERAGERV
jgi:hypothetical protein